MAVMKEVVSTSRSSQLNVDFPTQILPMRAGSKVERLKIKLANLALMAGIGLRNLKDPAKVWRALRVMDYRRRQFQGDGPLRKAARVGDRYFWDCTAPGYPSRALAEHHRRAFHNVYPFLEQPGLRVVYFSITKKCNLRCRHCYEWDQLHKPEQLSRQDLIEIIRKFQDFGVGVFHLEGGEPLLRFDDLLALLDHADDRSDFWIITSGLSLTAEKATRLREHGLTGVTVSLDHWEAEKHNDFRGHKHAYEWVIRAVVNANQAGLVTALSLCTTEEMTSRENLDRYMELARSLGVSFVQWLEPRAVGHFAGQDVELSPAAQERLEEAFQRYNLDKRYRDYPLIVYPAHLQRTAGCPGAGQLFLYVDSNGAVHSCPFCQHPVGSALKLPVADLVSLVQQLGCEKFTFFAPADSSELQGMEVTVETVPK